jgi:class 3 adenylate cyclase
MTLPLEAPSSLAAESATNPLSTHRRQVTVVFIDLRGFTAFTETAEPEDVVEVLREYHAEMGRLIAAHAGALERFTRDGVMVCFDNRVSVANPPERALSMVFDMRDPLGQLTSKWRKRSSTSWRRSRLATSRSRAFSGRCRSSTLDPGRETRDGSAFPSRRSIRLVYVRER